MDMPSRRLVIPATRVVSSETLLLVTPWFLRKDAVPAQSVPPAILTFTRDDFMPAFFKAVERGKAEAFEKLNRYRDYAEPPEGMLDVHGAPLYPPSIRRLPPTALEPDSEGTGDLDADGIPHSAPGAPPWFRKLYLPIHQHYSLVCLEAVCRRRDYPQLSRKRVIEAGMVIRRLVPNSSEEQWEDWISADQGVGTWIGLADPDMEREQGNDKLVVDPGALARFIPASLEPVLRVRLGLAADDPLPERLPAEKLALLPPKIGTVKTLSVLYGYLPLQSSEHQAPTFDAGSGEVQAMRQALAQRARRHLEAELLGRRTPPGAVTQLETEYVHKLRQRIQTPLLKLLQHVVLPPRPVAMDVNNASQTLTSFPGAPPKPLQALRQTSEQFLLEALRMKSDDHRPVSNWWQDVATAAMNAFAQNPQSWAKQALAAHGQATGVWLREVLHGAVARFLPDPGNAAQAQADEWRAVGQVITVSLLRVRAMRKALAGQFYKVIFPDAERPDLEETDAAGNPSVTVSSLSGELESLFEANTSVQRRLRPPPWPKVTLDEGHVKAHQLCRQTEEVLADVEARGAGAGIAYTEEVDARTAQWAKKLAPLFSPALLYPISAKGTPSQSAMRKRGVDFSAQPERGLFGFPGVAPTLETTKELISSVAERYSGAAAAGALSELRIRDEVKVLQDTPRPRYDSESLYAIWCYVRVAGRQPCEKDRLLWSGPSDLFSIAEPLDILGSRPVSVELPNLKKLVRDIPRLPLAHGRGFAAVHAPADSDVNVGESPSDTSRKWGISWICSFGIPVFTICAWVAFKIIFSVLVMIPGFVWLLFLKFCIPIPGRR